MASRGPLCAGIDPHPGLLTAWGLDDDAAGLERFSMTAVEALAPTVAAIKPQSAFFERRGSAGLMVLEKVVAAGRAPGAQVVVDVKRGDIGSTRRADAEAHLDPNPPVGVDAITPRPLLRPGWLRPDLPGAPGTG